MNFVLEFTSNYTNILTVIYKHFFQTLYQTNNNTLFLHFMSNITDIFGGLLLNSSKGYFQGSYQIILTFSESFF